MLNPPHQESQVFIFFLRHYYFHVSLVTEALDSCLEAHRSLEDIPELELNLTHIIIYGIGVL